MTFRMHTMATASALALLALPIGARAADAADDGTIIVTALRTPVDETKVSSSVTVIDSAALDQMQPLALSDVLDRTPSIALARTGGYGQVTSLRIRGADPAETVLVFDGMRLSDPTAIAGGFDFTHLFADDIARVEVLRGPQSILWGSDALGGIISVTTTAPTRPLQADLSVEGGSHDTVDARAGIGGTSRLIDWRLSGSEFYTAGIPTLIGGTQANGYARQGASGTVTVHLSATVSLDLRGYWSNARNSFSDTFSLPAGIYPGDYALSKTWSVYAGLNVLAFDGRLKNRFSVQQDQTDNEDLYPLQSPPLSFVGHGRTDRYEYQGVFAASKAIDLVFGAEREEQHMRVGSPYDAIQPYELFPEVANTDSVYGQARLTPLTGLTLNGGLRYDHHSQFGGNTVFSTGATFTPDAGTTVLRASYDEAFKAPSLYQLYSDYGSATLQPERAHGWELGAERSLFGRAVQLGAVWWQRRTTNLIGFAYCPYPVTPSAPPACLINGYGYYANIDAAYGQGLELTAKARLGHVFADGNYAIVVNEDRSAGSATYGVQLPRVPRHQANATLGYDLPAGISTSVALRVVGASFDNAATLQVLPAYALVDWRVEWTFGKGITLFARIDNLGDRQYQSAVGYNSLGRTGYLGLRGHF